MTRPAGPPGPRTSSPAGADRGQAVVELALALPLLVLFLLTVVQLTVVVRDQLAVVHAAREGLALRRSREHPMATPPLRHGRRHRSPPSR